ncbi:hypothetical protein BCD67_25025 [Oscillatoriales cyanobacterium USR001]|nr:hypothetical protein BCD67_25025 [Oscillatoriales cyanobacterium USR001]
MTIKYLIDENMSPVYQDQLLRRQPDLTVLMVGDCDVPQKGTKDPEILRWCEENNFILVTNNRRSMPVHLAEHLAENRHIPGILALRPNSNIGLIIEDLIAIAGAAFEDEYQDQIVYVPLRITR